MAQVLFNVEYILHFIHRFRTDIPEIDVSDLNYIAKYTPGSSDFQCKWRSPGYCHLCGIEENNSDLRWGGKESYYSENSCIFKNGSDKCYMIRCEM